MDPVMIEWLVEVAGVATCCAVGVLALPWSNDELANSWGAWVSLPELAGRTAARAGQAVGRLEFLAWGRVRGS